MIGTINSLSGPVPGLGASSLGASRAYVAYRNSIGGVCGRKIVLRDGDDGVDNARNRQLVTEMGPKVLAFVGGNAAGSDGGADVIRTNNIPQIGMSSGTELQKVPSFYPISPRDNATFPAYHFLAQQGVSKAAVVYVSAGPAIVEGRRVIGLLREAGIEVVLDQQIPLSTLSYDSTARSVANSGADYLVFVHAAGPSASMAQSLAQIGYELTYAEYRIAYGSNFIELAGAAAENGLTWITSLPTEDGGTNPEHKAFLEWMRRTAPNAGLDTFASGTWGSMKLVFDLLESLPGPITREALLAALANTGVYDAVGLLAPIEVGNKHDQGCSIGMVVKGGNWERLTPAQGFLC